jgi:hypothetical protein
MPAPTNTIAIATIQDGSNRHEGVKRYLSSLPSNSGTDASEEMSRSSSLSTANWVIGMPSTQSKVFDAECLRLQDRQGQRNGCDLVGALRSPVVL